MKTLFYCHNSLGIGHVTRTLKLAEGLRDVGPVAVICGGLVPDNLYVPDGVDVYCLPPLSMHIDGSLYDPVSRQDPEAILTDRAIQIVEIGRRVAPGALIVEMFPFGRKKFKKEILALITAVKTISSAKVFASVRDVLVTAREDQVVYDQRAVGWLNQYFDVLLIHSDENLFSLAETFSAYSQITIPIHYTGYVAKDPVPGTNRESNLILSAGGGPVGQHLIDSIAEAANTIFQTLNLRTMIIHGSNKPAAVSEISDSVCRNIQFVKNLSGLLACSSLSVSQCGYNTATDVLASGVAAVFVPFSAPGENEQTKRAQLFARKNRAVVLADNDLNTDQLIQAARKALKQNINTSVQANLGGVVSTTKIVRKYCL